MTDLEMALRDVIKQLTGKTDEEIDALLAEERARYDRVSGRQRDPDAIDLPPVWRGDLKFGPATEETKGD